MAEPLSPSDLSAIQAERGPVHMHVGGVLVFDGHVTREAVIERLEVWVEDEAFDAARHVRRAALPAPGGEAELLELVGHVLSERLDRSRPLWQLVVVEGLEDGRSAIVAKMHHALVDGVAAVDVSTVVLDPTPEGLDLSPPDAEPAAAPGRGARMEQLARNARVDQLARIAAAQLAVPRKLARETVARAFTTDPRTAARQAREAASVISEPGSMK
jgi:diacylglycerol O-acyltransferase